MAHRRPDRDPSKNATSDTLHLNQPLSHCLLRRQSTTRHPRFGECGIAQRVLHGGDGALVLGRQEGVKRGTDGFSEGLRCAQKTDRTFGCPSMTAT